MTSYRLHFEHVLGEDEGYKCAKWAFGEGFEVLTTEKLPERWNNLHSNLFIIHGDGDIFEDIEKIIEFWKLSLEKA